MSLFWFGEVDNMKPGTLVKLSGRQNRVYSGVEHIRKVWFNVFPEQIGMYIKTIRTRNGLRSDIVLIGNTLVQVAQGVMVPVE